MSTPESARPNPPPTPKTAETAPIAVPTFSDGNSSLMIENASGKTAAPDPCRMRNPISAPMCQAKDRAEASGQEEAQADHEQALFAELIAQLPNERGCHRGREKEAGEHPRGPGGSRVELALQDRQRWDDHRLLKRERDPCEDEDRERDVVVLPDGLAVIHEPEPRGPVRY